jgi:hypothetical protein
MAVPRRGREEPSKTIAVSWPPRARRSWRFRNNPQAKSASEQGRFFKKNCAKRQVGQPRQRREGGLRSGKALVRPNIALHNLVGRPDCFRLSPRGRRARQKRKLPRRPGKLRPLHHSVATDPKINRRGPVLAEGAGFEPAIRFPVYTLSRRAPSTARPPLHALLASSASRGR